MGIAHAGMPAAAIRVCASVIGLPLRCGVHFIVVAWNERSSQVMLTDFSPATEPD